jgi:hypothetical protein
MVCSDALPSTLPRDRATPLSIKSELAIELHGASHVTDNKGHRTNVFDLRSHASIMPLEFVAPVSSNRNLMSLATPSCVPEAQYRASDS